MEKAVKTTKKAYSPKPMSLKKELPGLFCLLLALLFLSHTAVNILRPKRAENGAVWSMYLAEPKNSVDILFLGSSIAYCDVVPAVMYEETGLSSYVMAGPLQTMPVTYYYLRECLKTQSPKLLVVEVSSLFYAPYNSSLKINLSYMPWGLNRLIPTVTELSPRFTGDPESDPGERFELFFPLAAYHNRWQSLTGEDWEKGLLGFQPDPFAGYTFLEKSTPFQDFSLREGCENEFFERNFSYLQKLRELCEKEGVPVVFCLFPSVRQVGEQEALRIRGRLSEKGAALLDFGGSFEEIGLSLSEDFYDEEHLNYQGAERFSRFLSASLPLPGSGAEKDPELWAQRVKAFGERKAEAALAQRDGEGEAS